MTEYNLFLELEENSKEKEETLPKTYPPLKPLQPKPHDLAYPFTLKNLTA